MNYVLVPDRQPVVPLKFVNYPNESDLDGGKSPLGLYPVPSNLPVETWPVGTGSLTLAQWQQDSATPDGKGGARIVALAGYRNHTLASGFPGTGLGNRRFLASGLFFHDRFLNDRAPLVRRATLHHHHV
jgi:hypothetical protein